MPRGDLFPEIGPFETGYLPLADGHVMYWEQVGNPRGAPVLFLHGGPGAGAGAVHRRFFDPGFWRVAIFDQRGAGRSRPLGSLAHNTTADLVQDIERLRRHLAIERWLLFGGSWGSTLALAYAQAYPQRVIGLVLRGVFLGRPVEVEWFLHGLAAIFPDAHAAFTGFLPEAERGDVLGGYLRRLTHPDPMIHMPAARAWSVYEGSCSTLLPSPDTVASFAQDRTALGLARIEAYYFANGLFLPPEGLLAGMAQVGHLPGEIVQGRYDMICPARTAFDLTAAWPSARLTLVPDAGHSALEPGIRRALVAAVERFRLAR
ncbi:MAG TPA: prolyl aminopeptidase [Acetobacteraceae bacterium]|jgi:proline iminopeptidase|nr:prolyl aminopeptidase [Acetobacteraceae bacterium]